MVFGFFEDPLVKGFLLEREESLVVKLKEGKCLFGFGGKWEFLVFGFLELESEKFVRVLGKRGARCGGG